MKAPKQKRNEKQKSHIPFRLNLLFFIVFMLFSSLILRLAYLQIVRSDEYRAEVERTERTTITGSVPRGEIYDANLNKLVGNEARHSITYTRGKNVPASQMATVAYDLAEYITMPHTTSFEVDRKWDLSERDLKDYFIARNQEDVRERLSDEDLKLSGADSYNVMLDQVTVDEIQNFEERDLGSAAIFKKMNSAYSLSSINVKNNEVTQEEIARVSENLDKFPGIGTGTDWVRHYPEGNMLSSILGRVTTEEIGIPQDKLKTYLAKGYSRNDRVGKSQLESQYETILSGSKSKIDTETNSSGDIINQIEQFSGSKGDNLVLTMDIDYQKQVEQIAIDSLSEREGLNDSIYIAAMDPNNGDILAMTGKEINDGEVRDITYGIFNQTFNMGSTVKGATVLAAYMDGVLDESNNVIVDEPIQVGGQRISSVYNRTGSVVENDISALEVSSNVYMSRLAMRMGGEWDYTTNMSLNINANNLLDKQRHYFKQFGLGVATGIDLPSEQTGLEGRATNPGEALYYSFGQYDTYTPLQLLQYSSVIANGGTRLAPRLVSEIRDTNKETGSVGALRTEIEPRILNTIDVSDSAMKRVQQGFYEVVNGNRGSARSVLGGTPYVSAGKTGTAQGVYWDDELNQTTESVINLTYVGYAPYDNPEIAIAVVVPNLPLNNRTNRENVRASRRVLDAYFKVGEFEEKGTGEMTETLEDFVNEAENLAEEENNDEDDIEE